MLENGDVFGLFALKASTANAIRETDDIVYKMVTE